MNHYHNCIWIDHREAKLFGIGLDAVDKHDLHDSKAPHHIHRKADHVHLGKSPADAQFLSEVADALKPAGAILIAGPGQAKLELASYLKSHHPDIAKRVWAVEQMDHPTDGEVVAAARKFFKAADRMHG